MRGPDEQYKYDGFDRPADSEAFQVLKRNLGKWMSTTEVRNLTQCSRSKINRHLLSLERGGVIQRKRVNGLYFQRVVS